MKYVSLIILAVILAFAYIQYDITDDNTVFEVEDEKIEAPVVDTTAPKTKTSTAGFVSEIAGAVYATESNGEQRQLQPSGQIYVGDTIETSAETNLTIMMDDGGQVTLEPNTQFRIVEFNYDSTAQNNISLTELIKGKLRVLSGKIGKNAKDKYGLTTRIATIGIRGTHYVARVCLENECKIEYEENLETLNNGLYVGVIEGAVFTESQTGTQEIKVGETFYQESTTIKPQAIEPVLNIVFSAEDISDLGIKDKGSRKKARAKHWIINNRDR